MVDFLLRKIFRRNLDRAISLAEIDVTFNQGRQFQLTKLLHLDFWRKIFLKRKLTFGYSHKKAVYYFYYKNLQ